MAKKLNTSNTTQYMVALPEPDKIRPAFSVKKIDQPMPHKVHMFDKQANKIRSKIVQEPGGYLVTFRKGHSIRCRNEAHLKRIGANVRLIPLVNDEGEIKGMTPNIDLPEIEDEREEEIMAELNGE
jgi:hypothetical protein